MMDGVHKYRQHLEEKEGLVRCIGTCQFETPDGNAHQVDMTIYLTPEEIDRSEVDPRQEARFSIERAVNAEIDRRFPTIVGSPMVCDYQEERFHNGVWEPIE